MSSNVFSCPSCGAPLAAIGDQSQVRCSYCGSTVVVPEALRPKPAPRAAPQAPYTPYAPIQQVVIVEPRQQMVESPVVVRDSGGLGCFGTLLAVLLIFGLLGGFLFLYRPIMFSALLSHFPRFGSAMFTMPQISSFTASPDPAQSGGTVTVQWSADADTVRIDRITAFDVQTVASQPSRGTRAFSVPDNVNQVIFQLTASKGGSQTSRHITVQIQRR